MRQIFTLFHRWLGLMTAIFLIIAGATGALIAWDHELDAALAPTVYKANTVVPSRAKDPLTLADQFESENPHAHVTYLPLSIETGHTLRLSVWPRTNPISGAPYDLGYDQAALNPATGETQAKRLLGAFSLAPDHWMPFLYKLHYTLHLPFKFGVETGVLLMGLIGVAWTIDTFIALYISFPNKASWRKSFAFRLKQGGHKLTFDLHRSGGVWIYPLVLMMAFTSISMNLNNEIMRPLVGVFSQLTPNPFAAPPLSAASAAPPLSRRDILERAKARAEALNISVPPGAIFYAPDFKIYGVGYFAPGQDHGDGGLGNPWLYFDAQTGAPKGQSIPGAGTGGDIFLQAQFPLHSGRIIGLPGRILISALGVLIAALSITGILIWARKRKARRSRTPRVTGAPAGG